MASRGDPWLAAAWPFVRAHLPPSPARVVDLGCGSRGGFVPALLDADYDAVGVDPNAPEGDAYRRSDFESFEPAGRLGALVASTSLHHVHDLDGVLDRVVDLLAPGGRAIVIEWAWERFDERTARWCFDRLAVEPAEPSWLHRVREDWLASGQPWEEYKRAWAEAEGLHRATDIVRALEPRFELRELTWGPYFFCDLAGTSEADEQAAIDAGLIEASRVQFAGVRA
jgi:SAM-dependent methyltransferase